MVEEVGHWGQVFDGVYHVSLCSLSTMRWITHPSPHTPATTFFAHCRPGISGLETKLLETMSKITLFSFKFVFVTAERKLILRGHAMITSVAGHIPLFMWEGSRVRLGGYSLRNNLKNKENMKLTGRWGTRGSWRWWMDMINIHCINTWNFQRIKLLGKKGTEGKRKKEGRIIRNEISFTSMYWKFDP